MRWVLNISVHPAALLPPHLCSPPAPAPGFIPLETQGQGEQMVPACWSSMGMVSSQDVYLGWQVSPDPWCLVQLYRTGEQWLYVFSSAKMRRAEGDADTLSVLWLLKHALALARADEHFHALAVGVRLLHTPAGAGTHPPLSETGQCSARKCRNDEV